MMKVSSAATITSISSKVFCVLNCALISPAFMMRVSNVAPKVFLFLLLPQPATCRIYVKKKRIYNLKNNQKRGNDLVL